MGTAGRESQSERLNVFTEYPRARAKAESREPMNPVAPVINIVVCVRFAERLIAF